jgi:hypothetical protein
LIAPGGSATLSAMERIVHVARSFEEALDWDIEQHLSMTPEERRLAVKEMQDRVYGPDRPDVRESHGSA